MALTALSGALARRLLIPTCAKDFSGVAVVGEDVLLRLEKSHIDDRRHEFTTETRKRIMVHLWMEWEGHLPPS